MPETAVSVASDASPTLPYAPAPVRRSAAEPLYAQVARDLATHVRRGTMAPGQRLPAEPVLARAYGVNRLTVREALTTLSRQGLRPASPGGGQLRRRGRGPPPGRRRPRKSHRCLESSGFDRGRGRPRGHARAGRGGPRRTVRGIPRAGHDPVVAAGRPGRSVVAVPDLAADRPARTGTRASSRDFRCRRCSPSAMVCAPSRPTAWSPRRRPHRRTANISTSRRVHR